MRKKITYREITVILVPLVLSSIPLGLAWIAAESGKNLEVLICLTLCIVFAVGIPVIVMNLNISKILERLERLERKSAKKSEEERKR